MFHPRITTMTTCGLALAFALTLTVSVQAQDDAPLSAKYRHGNQVSVSLKDGSTLSGRVVWAGEDFLMVRPRPGVEPIPVVRSEINPVALKREGITGGAPFEKVELVQPKTYESSSPEISKVTIRNGNFTTIRYLAPTLSGPEKDVLAELEIAENLLAKTEGLNQFTQALLVHERELATAKAQALIQYYYAPPLYYGYSQRVGTGVAGVGFAGLGGIGLAGGLGLGAGVPVVAGSSYGWASYPYYRFNPTAFEVPDNAFKTAAAQALIQSMTPESLAKAQEAAAMARRNVIYSDEGRIVAVRLTGHEGGMIRPAAGEDANRDPRQMPKATDGGINPGVFQR